MQGSAWILFTLIAASAQTARNAMQRGLIGTLGAVGATHVRFIFGLPFAVLFLVGVRLWTGTALPHLGPVPLGWTAFGAAAQFAATALMLMTMRDRSFVISTAYIKTEPVQVALFALLALGERPRPLTLVAIVVATLGVMIVSWPKRSAMADGPTQSWQSVGTGLVAGGLFALSAVGYRGAILGLTDTSWLTAATVILVASLTIHTVVLASALALFDRPVMLAILRQWRPSLLAGFMGALASQFWFLAFALADAAPVRTLGLVEVVLAGLVSRRLGQRTAGRDVAGMAIIVAGVCLLLNA